MRIAIKRVYEKASRTDGRRILVDRIWPRGLTKADAAIDDWLKALAPSSALRTWFNHDPARWTEFQRRYARELDADPEGLAELRHHVKAGPVTLVYAARDELHNNAVALKHYLEHHPRR
jgi:uncharacterized protein YeaO (DUF488 family)